MLRFITNDSSLFQFEIKKIREHIKAHNADVYVLDRGDTFDSSYRPATEYNIIKDRLNMLLNLDVNKLEKVHDLFFVIIKDNRTTRRTNVSIYMLNNFRDSIVRLSMLYWFEYDHSNLAYIASNELSIHLTIKKQKELDAENYIIQKAKEEKSKLLLLTGQT